MKIGARLALACAPGAIGVLGPGAAAAQKYPVKPVRIVGPYAAEILNIMASLFNLEGAPHLRLYATYAPREAMPADVQKWVLAYVQRLDMELTVAGYGSGNISVLVV